jgi:HlyD family secretion protein
LQIEQARTAQNEARAQMDRTSARLAQARRDAQRYENLAQAEATSRLQAENMRLSVVVEEKALLAARETQTRAEKQLALAKLGEQRIAAQSAQRDAVAAQVKQAEAQLAEQEGILERFVVKSPLAGVILTRTIELGEWVNVGAPLFTLVDLDQLYLKVYIPEPQIGKVALGQEARVCVDAYTNKGFAARVSKVAQQAEFTPKNVETREERVKLVFAVELHLLENPGGILKPGMPADGIIRWREGAEWIRP